MNNWRVCILMNGRWQLIEKGLEEEEAAKKADEWRKYYNNKYNVSITTYDLRFMHKKEKINKNPWWKRLWKWR